jgi:hypothetical protein
LINDLAIFRHVLVLANILVHARGGEGADVLWVNFVRTAYRALRRVLEKIRSMKDEQSGSVDAIKRAQEELRVTLVSVGMFFVEWHCRRTQHHFVQIAKNRKLVDGRLIARPYG